MVYNTADYWVIGICPSCRIIKTQRFGNWICFQNIMFCITLDYGKDTVITTVKVCGWVT
jgi:hypothetical protein